MHSITKLVQTLEAFDDTGHPYTVKVFQEFHVGIDILDRRFSVPGVKRLETSDGLPVQWISKGRYVILDPGNNYPKLQCETSDAP
jgi:hypothetical protein